MAEPDYPPPGQPGQPPMYQPIPGSQPIPVQPPPGGRAAGFRFRMDCAQDLQRFCYGVQPGGGRLVQCILSHRSQLSPPCMTSVAALRPGSGVPPPSYRSTQNPGLPSAGPPSGQAPTASAMRASCGPDVQRLCAGVGRENSGVIKCLSSHRMELSPTCNAFLRELPPPRAAQRGAPINVPPSPKTMPTATPSAGAPPAPTSPPAAATAPADSSQPSASPPAIRN
jgi:hypothetical protein